MKTEIHPGGLRLLYLLYLEIYIIIKSELLDDTPWVSNLYVEAAYIDALQVPEKYYKIQKKKNERWSRFSSKVASLWLKFVRKRFWFSCKFHDIFQIFLTKHIRATVSAYIKFICDKVNQKQTLHEN